MIQLTLHEIVICDSKPTAPTGGNSRCCAAARSRSPGSPYQRYCALGAVFPLQSSRAWNEMYRLRRSLVLQQRLHLHCIAISPTVHHDIQPTQLLIQTQRYPSLLAHGIFQDVMKFRHPASQCRYDGSMSPSPTALLQDSAHRSAAH